MLELKNVKVLDDYKLLLDFKTGEQKVYDFAPNLAYEIYAPLKNKVLFAKARAEAGGVVWNDVLDISGDELYDNGVNVQALAFS